MGERRPVNGNGKMAMALISLLFIFLGEIVGVVVAYIFDWDLDLCATLGGAVAAVVALFALGGESHLRLDGKAIAESWRFMWWIVAISAVLMVWDLYDYIAAGEQIVAGWPMRCLSSLVLCLGIGASEEGMFRGALFGGLLARMGGSRKGLWWAVAISSLAFGCAHVGLEDLDPANYLTFVQAGFKILQTGMYAVMLCAVVLKTKSLVGAMTVHAIDDWLLFVVSTGLYGEVFETVYVTPDRDEAIATIIFYAIICTLYLPTFIKSIITLRDIELPQWGPLVSEKDLTPLPEAAAPMPYGVGVPAGYGAPQDLAVPFDRGYAPQGYAQQPQQMPQQHVTYYPMPTPADPLLPTSTMGQPPQPDMPMPAQPQMPQSTMGPQGVQAPQPYPQPVQSPYPQAAQPQYPQAAQQYPQPQYPQAAPQYQQPYPQQGHRPPAPEGF